MSGTQASPRPQAQTPSPLPAQPSVQQKVAATERRMADQEPEGTIVEGMEDDRLWILLRGFNKQVNHVLSPTTHPVSQPDLRHTSLPNVPYRSDTLKVNLERLIKGLAPLTKRGVLELARVTDWDNEFYRTATYCAAYFLAWGLGVLFPYRPSTTDSYSLLESDPETTPMTGPEQSEEVSVQATAVLAGFASALLFGTKEEGNALVGPKDLHDNSGMDEGSDVIGSKLDSREVAEVNGKTSLDSKAEIVEVVEVVEVAEANGKTTLVRESIAEDAESEVERKRNEIVRWMVKTTETTIGTGADYIEILQKALSPPPVYPDYYARFKIAALLVVAALALHYVPARMWGRGFTLAFGVVVWGHKWLEMGVRELLRRFPNWKELVDPRNSILSGVPTDAQLALHLLRVSEAEGDPLPTPPVAPALEATKEAVSQATPSAPDLEVEADAAPTPAHKAAVKSRKKTRGVFRKLVRRLASMGSDVAFVGEERKLKGKIDSLVLKAKWGDDVPPGGYSAKLNGTSGHLFIDEDHACISWVPMLSKSPERVWYVDDLVEMKKDELGTSRLALAAMSGAEIASLGLSLRFAKTADDISVFDMTEEQVGAAQAAKETLEFKGVEAREALFNRLIAMGSQRWEML
ncbi:uncharacterized protein CcaverHIS019_0705650 [Cutaneotrichosporon cavernicola]|uniref:Uncharacterized protein n=1 Tax=Cutaneotrichosporon cavernicola TaxID=279322 RepID=A0AA48LAF6_9TREE|nr:uncharacterized protein CcaverHIS019_0705650 [Cutaneotrichosporon cavernicola]BEI94984.1 hypothetical protein CcaverHIS019_0705650 [Cutaneotrichosporon cavernicola]BEJ02758.1 hypothetical protein CcaverHIS631_0705530 [Cutaneotrichosporon cavernicola]